MATGQNIRRLRLDRGWKLEHLSELSGVAVGTISSLEVKNSVRSQYFGAIADAFGVTLELESGKSVPLSSRSADPVIADLAALPTAEAAIFRAEIASRAAIVRLAELKSALNPSNADQKEPPGPKAKKSA